MSRSAESWLQRSRAASLHFAICLVIGILVALLVFLLWYPSPFREIAGGRELFLIIIAVDIALGPLVTFAVFDRRKPGRELRRDLAVVVTLQLAGLAYGLHTVYQARPVVLALEKDRLRAVRVIDLEPQDLIKAPPELANLPMFGILHVATRPVMSEEKVDAALQGLSGRDIGARPEFWLPASQAYPAWAAGGRPIAKLRAMHPTRSDEVDAAISATRLPESALKYLPIIARRIDYVMLIDGSSGRPVGFAALDGHY
jgi:hypothetical protein